MKISRSALEKQITRTVAEALDVELCVVKLHSSLLDDLGAESIDFLDIRYRVETDLGIKVEEQELWQGFLLSKGDGLLDDAGVTQRGMALLKEAMPEFRWDRFPEQISVSDLPRLITVRSIVESLCRRPEIEVE